MPIKPVLQSLLLADQVYVDRDTGKRIIAGVFDDIESEENAKRFTKAAHVYIALTGIHGTAEITIRYVDLSSNEVIKEYAPVSTQSEDPLRCVDLAFEIPSLPIPHEGVFALEVHSWDELLGSMRITAKLLRQGHEEQGETE